MSRANITLLDFQLFDLQMSVYSLGEAILLWHVYQTGLCWTSVHIFIHGYFKMFLGTLSTNAISWKYVSILGSTNFCSRTASEVNQFRHHQGSMYTRAAFLKPSVLVNHWWGEWGNGSSHFQSGMMQWCSNVTPTQHHHIALHLHTTSPCWNSSI